MLFTFFLCPVSNVPKGIFIYATFICIVDSIGSAVFKIRKFFFFQLGNAIYQISCKEMF